MTNFEQLEQCIKQSPKKIIILIHQLPDADALGSSLGFSIFLKKIGHDVVIISPTNYPAFLAWMPHIDSLLIYNKNKEAMIASLLYHADMVFCLDFSSLHRINELGAFLKKSAAKKIIIDHHLNPENFAEISIWDANVSSTAELIYNIFEALKVTQFIDQDIASCLYAGILTDTGMFKHANTTARAHRITANLIDKGINVSHISRLIYDNNSINRLQFTGFAIQHRLVVLEKYQTAYFKISQEDMTKFDLQIGDTEGLVNYAISLKNINLAALLKEKINFTRISFRSIGQIPVNTLAERYFEGGGHKNAAGGKSNFPLEETIKKFETIIKKEIKI